MAPKPKRFTLRSPPRVNVPSVISSRLEDIPAVEGHGLEIDSLWKPVRHHLGVEVFGINAYVGESEGDLVIEEHDEADDEYGGEHQELYFVARGRAEFGVGDQTLDAPAGTFVFYDDPTEKRRAVAREPGTTVLAMGATKGVAFTPSSWETQRTAGLPHA
jgi:hypothetical protein